MTTLHNPARFVLGNAFTWNDLMDTARYRAEATGHRQRVRICLWPHPEGHPRHRYSFLVTCEECHSGMRRASPPNDTHTPNSVTHQ